MASYFLPNDINGPYYYTYKQPKFTPKPENICPFCVQNFSDGIGASHRLSCRQNFIQQMQSFTNPQVLNLEQTVEKLKKKIEMLEKLLNPGGLEDVHEDDDF